MRQSAASSPSNSGCVILRRTRRLYIAYLGYDTTKLRFDSTLSSYTDQPFPQHFILMADAETTPGEILLEGHVGFDNPDGTDEDSKLAILKFEVLADWGMHTDHGVLQAGRAFAPELPWFGHSDRTLRFSQLLGGLHAAEFTGLPFEHSCVERLRPMWCRRKLGRAHGIGPVRWPSDAD